MGTLYHTAPWFDAADDESAIDVNAVADPTNEEKGCCPFSCLSPWPASRPLACEENAYKTEFVPESVPLVTWSDADGDDDDDDNEGDFYPFSCLCSWPAPRPLPPGR